MTMKINNPIVNYVENLTDEELKVCCKELLELHDTTILPNSGKVREFMNLITEEVGNSAYSLSVAESTINKEVLKRYSKQ